METLYDTLFDNPAIDPEGECLVFEGRRVTYGQLRRRVTRLANALSAGGIGRGDRVIVLLHNCPQFVEAFYAVTSLGALIVPLNWRLHAVEHVALMKDCTPRAILSESEFHETLKLAANAVESLDLCILLDQKTSETDVLYDDLIASGTDLPLKPDLAGIDDAGIIYTSGTTSLPKGAVLTHGNYLADHDNVGSFAGLDAASINLQVSPLYHAASMHTFMHVTYGGCTVMMSKFEPQAALSLIESERVTYVFGVPTVIYALLDCPKLGGTDLSTLRTFSYGAAPMSTARFAEAAQAFGYIFIHAYGMTESSSHSSLLGKEEHKCYPGSVGRGLKHARVRVADDQGVDCPPGRIGEILISGPQVMSRYWKRPEATAETLIEGWLHSGDLGVSDTDGYFYVKDRRRDLIISGGVNIYPREVEDVIAAHPAVGEVAVYGIADEKWGEAVAAAVVLRDRHMADADTIRKFTGQRLARFKIPKYIEFLAELPKNPSGKVLKRVLQERSKAVSPV